MTSRGNSWQQAGWRQTAGELGLAAVVAVLWADGLPLADDDPFRSTLVILPLAVAALRGLDRRARSLGARRVGGAAGSAEALALLALVVLTFERHRFGLAGADRLLAGGYLLLLAHFVARRLVAWRPCLGTDLPTRPPAIFALLPLVVYLTLQPWMSEHRQPDGDEPFYLLLTHSLAFDFDAELTNNYAGGDWRHFMTRAIEPQPGDPVGPRGEILSRHSLALPLALAPAYRLAGRRGAMAMIAAICALLAWMVLRLASRYAPREAGAALLAYGIFAFAPPLLIYSYQIWIEVPAALLLAFALDRILSLRRRQRLTASQIALLVLPLALLPLLKLRLGLVAMPLLFLAWLRARPGRSAMIRVAGGFAAVLGGLLLWNALRFDNPLKMHRWSDLDALANPPAEYLRGAAGMFFDTAFGLFPCAPIWFLVLPAVALLWQWRSSLLLDSAIVTLPYLLALWPRAEWYGGWSPPFRYGMVMLPLLALVLVPLLAVRARPGLRTLAAALAALTLVFAMVWVAAPGLTYNFADGRTLLLDEAGARLEADVARFFPSTVRPRPATWIWVLASLLLVPFALGSGRRRGRSTPAWGVAAVLVLLAAGAYAVPRWPTATIEFEDAYVRKHKGRITPPMWVTNRPYFRSGWVLPAGAWLSAPVVAGGERVTIRLAAKLTALGSATTLRIAAGEVPLATWAVERDDWQETTLGPFDWPAGAPLVIRAPDPLTADRTQVIVDRAELDWTSQP